MACVATRFQNGSQAFLESVHISRVHSRTPRRHGVAARRPIWFSPTRQRMLTALQSRYRHGNVVSMLVAFRTPAAHPTSEFDETRLVPASLIRCPVHLGSQSSTQDLLGIRSKAVEFLLADKFCSNPQQFATSLSLNLHDTCLLHPPVLLVALCAHATCAPRPGLSCRSPGRPRCHCRP